MALDPPCACGHDGPTTEPVPSILVAAFALMVIGLLPSAGLAEPAMIAGTARVMDGDTIDVGVVRIRLHGIDAPEAGQTCGTADGGTWTCGTVSTDRLA